VGGTILPLIPGFLIYFGMFSILRAIRQLFMLHGYFPVHHATLPLGFGCVIVGYILAFGLPRLQLVGSALLLAVLTFVFAIWEKEAMTFDAIAAASLFIQLLIFGSQIWLPCEEIVRSDEPKRVVGYVIRHEGDWLTTLRESDRQVLYLKTSAIEKRAGC
jgi:hypothetical protein